MARQTAQCPLVGARGVLADLRDRDRIVEKARDGHGQKSIWEMSDESL